MQVQVPVSSLDFGDDGKQKHCGIEIYGALVDKTGSWVGDGFLFTKAYRLDLDSGQFQALMSRDNVTSDISKNVAAGNYQLQIVVRQGPAKRIATMSRPITIR